MSSALGYEIILSKQIINNAYKERRGAMVNEVQKVVRQYYILRAIAAFGYGSILATYVHFLRSNGLSLFQTHLVNFVFLAVLLMFEVPTGVFADRYGRKLSFVISCFVTSLSKVVYAFSSSLPWFFVAEIISGIGVTLASGAIQAWLVDELKLYINDRHELNQKIRSVFVYENQIKNALLVVSALIGSRVAEYRGSYPWIITAVCMFVAGLYSAFLLKDQRNLVYESRVKTQEPFSIRLAVRSLGAGFKELLRSVVQNGRLARANDVVMLVVVMGLAQHFAGQAPSMQWQPFLHQHLPRERELGMVFAGSMFLQLVGSWLAPHWMRAIGNEQKTLALTQIMFGASIALTTVWSSLPPILLFFGLHQVARGMYVPIKDAYLNHHIPSEQRAALISFEAQSHHLGGMAGLLVAGLLGKYVSMTCAWVFMGTIVVLSGIRHFLQRMTR